MSSFNKLEFNDL